MSALFEAYAGCPLCNAPTLPERQFDCTMHELWHEPLPKTMEWMRCQTCGHGHTKTYWTPAGLAELFQMAHAGQTAGTHQDPDNVRARWNPPVQNAVKLLGGWTGFLARDPRPIWLDVGCGDGGLAMTARELGFEEVALDARPQTTDTLKRLGLNAFAGDFMGLALSQPATVISMLDVLEHLPFPVAALRHARSLLADNGVLILSLPDEDASSWKMADVISRSAYWIEIEHHHNFSLRRLAVLLDAVGFELVDVALPYRYRAQIEVYARPKG